MRQSVATRKTYIDNGTHTHIQTQIIRSECNQNEKIKNERWQNGEKLQPLTTDKTCLANLFSFHIASLCAWKNCYEKKIEPTAACDGTEKKNNQNKNEERKKRKKKLYT